MRVWRDVWDGMPTVVILAEEDAQVGVLTDAVLFLFEVSEPVATVTDPSGKRMQVHLPAQALGQTGFVAGVELIVETPNEETH